MMKILNHSVRALHKLLRERTISARELLSAVFSKIEEAEPQIHAFLTRFRSEAERDADLADARLKENRELDPLTGIPLAIKDVICIRNQSLTCGSKMLENYRSPYD